MTIFDRERVALARSRAEARSGAKSPTRAQVAAAVEGADVVYHLAALADLNEGKTKPIETARVNLLGTLNVLEAMRARAAQGANDVRLDHLRLLS